MKVTAMIFSALFASSAAALQVGDRVPDLAVPSTSGENVRLTDFSGKWVVLYFYPRSFTPGCTAQSCSLRDEYGELQERGAVILGASLDPVERQIRFREEHRLPFHILSDTSKELARAFNSLALGGLMAARKSFIINPDGILAYRFESAGTGNHADEVIEQLDRLIAAASENN